MSAPLPLAIIDNNGTLSIRCTVGKCVYARNVDRRTSLASQGVSLDQAIQHVRARHGVK